MGSGITNSILLMLVVMLSINVGLTFTQTAVDGLTSDVTILNEGTSPLNNYYSGSLENGTSLITSDFLPTANATVTGDTGNFFTDTYTIARTYVTTGLSGVGFLVNVLSQPAGFLRDVGINSAICLAIQIIWSMMFIILITAWILGRT